MKIHELKYYLASQIFPAPKDGKHRFRRSMMMHGVFARVAEQLGGKPGRARKSQATICCRSPDDLLNVAWIAIHTVWSLISRFSAWRSLPSTAGVDKACLVSVRINYVEMIVKYRRGLCHLQPDYTTNSSESSITLGREYSSRDVQNFP
jgi:hypothetical protein